MCNYVDFGSLEKSQKTFGYVFDLAGEDSVAARRLQDALNQFKDARPVDLVLEVQTELI